MAHRPKKKSEFFNKGRSAVSSPPEDSISPSINGNTESQNSDLAADFKQDRILPSVSSEECSEHSLNGHNIVQFNFQKTNSHNTEEKIASFGEDYPSNSETAPVQTRRSDSTCVENTNLNSRDSDDFSNTSTSEAKSVSINDETRQLSHNSNRDCNTNSPHNSLTIRDGSHSPDSDEIEIIEEYVNSHYNPRKRKTRPDFYGRQNVRRAVPGYPVQPQHYPVRAAIRGPHHDDPAQYQVVYPHNSHSYHPHTRHGGPRPGVGYNADRSVVYTTVYEEHRTSVVNGTYPNHEASTFKVVSSRYPNEPPVYSPEVGNTAPCPSLYPSDVRNGHYMNESANVHNQHYLTNGPSISNCRSSIRPNIVEHSRENIQLESNARYRPPIGDHYQMELDPRRAYAGNGLGLNPGVNHPPPPNINPSYDSLSSRKSAFVPVGQNTRTIANLQRQPPLEVPLQPAAGRPNHVPAALENPARCQPEPERPEAPQPPSEKKRFQTCRLCHNHGIITPIRGHKYVCPYNKCKCSNCKITLKRRHFVKEQLKITRRQNSSLQNGKGSVEPAIGNSVNLQEVQIKPFPQKDVMMKDLALFDDSELFEEIDSICRPQGRGKSS